MTPDGLVRRPLVGVLGGMGPAATADFYSRLVETTPATRDQDHLRVVIWADPSIPDRSQALLGFGPDPTPWLVRGVRVLIGAGADVLAIPCNTAHAFLEPVIRAAGHIPVLHLVERVCHHAQQLDPPVRTIGLLATTGTVRTRIYQKPLARSGIGTLVPDEHVQAHQVMPAIERIKAGRDAREAARALATDLVARGAQAVLAGCTELGMALRAVSLPVPLLDPAQILAEAAVTWARSYRHPSQTLKANDVSSSTPAAS